MILMTRMYLINWHNFVEDIIDFKNITYLIGLNAVGKTTIMDAIRYCLTTNKDFNAAGNKKSGRSLQGSVHQKQRAEDHYLRPSHTVTYIGIEFFDESINKTFVITVRVESESPKQELRQISQDWYITKPGYLLEDMPYFTVLKSGKRPSTKEEFKLDNRGLEKASSQADARRKICRVLGIGDADSPIGKKFNEVFHMGTSLEDITDIRKFIYTYILPEPEMNVEILHKDMRELERLQEVLEEAQEREKLLSTINEKIVEAKNLDGKVKINEALVSYAKLQDAIDKQKEAQRKINVALSTVEGCIKELEELEIRKKEVDEQVYVAKKDIDNNEENQTINYLEEQKKLKSSRYNTLIRESATFNNHVSQLDELKRQMIALEITCEWNMELIKDGEVTKANKLDAIRVCKESLQSAEEELKNQDARVRNNLHILEQQIKELTRKIEKLESGVMCYPREAEMVRDTINEKLVEMDKKPTAKLLCELLYMNDPEWQDAVESYLNTQRFNIVVSDEDYLIAKAVFVSLQEKVKGIGLIDTVNLMKKATVKRMDVKTLNTTVESKNPYAKAYVDYLMGSVVCCEKKDEIEQHKRSITKDLLRYQNYCLQRLRKQEQYIGIDALQQQLSNCRLQMKKNRGEKLLLEQRKNRFSELDNIYRTFVAGNAFKEMGGYCESQKLAQELFENITEIKDKIAEFKQNPLLLHMFNRLDACEKNQEEVIDQMTTVKANWKAAQVVIDNAEMTKDSLQQRIDEEQEEYRKVIDTHSQFIEVIETKYVEERKTKKASDIINNFGNRKQQDINARNKYIAEELLPLQRQYTATYSGDYLEGIEGDKQYQMAHTSLSNIALEEHKDALNKAQGRCKERFRKEVLFRMKDDTLRAKQQFRQLNKVMENLSYGEESYRFAIEGSKDKEMSIFYNIIIDKDNKQIANDNELMAFMDLNQSKVFESQVDEFMHRIMVDVENRAEENLTGQKNSAKSISTYVDYRTYLDYDIIVKNEVTGLEVPLSKVSGDGSGGENQAPFYVAICASLLQIYQQSDNCIRLILLDEAFNNMTSDRIEPMMKMFRELNVQLVLIATPEKCSSIFPYCDTTYSIVKYGTRNAIAAFEGA